MVVRSNEMHLVVRFGFVWSELNSEKAAICYLNIGVSDVEKQTNKLKVMCSFSTLLAVWWSV